MTKMKITESRLRGIIREELLRDDKIFSLTSEKMLRSYVVEEALVSDGLMTEWDLALAYSKGSRLLTEAQAVHGRLIVEGLFQSFVGAVRWVGGEVGQAVTKLARESGEALSAAGKTLMSLLEKVPGGRDAFDFLKEFTEEAAEDLKDYIKDAAKEFGEFIVENRDEILGAVFGASADDPGVIKKLKELVDKGSKDFGDQAGKVKEWVKKFETDPVAAAREYFDLRNILGSIVADLVKSILQKSKEAAKKVVRVFDSAGFTKSKLGMFYLRVLSFFSTDMSSEDTLESAAELWKAAKKLKSDDLDMEHRGRALLSVIPKILKGLVGGGSALEGIVRSAAGDPTAPAKLLKNAIVLVSKALQKLVASSGAEVLKSQGIDPDSRIGKLVINALESLVTAGAE